MTRNRRTMRNARAPLINAQAALAAAASHLANGRALEAMRSVRLTQDLLRLDSTLRTRLAYQARVNGEACEAERALREKAAALEQRTALLDAREERLKAEAVRLEQLGQQLNGLYAAVYAKGGGGDANASGASSATEAETVSGVAPL